MNEAEARKWIGKRLSRKMMIGFGLIEAKVEEPRKCADCERRHYAKGLCLNHYRSKRGERPRAIPACAECSKQSQIFWEHAVHGRLCNDCAMGHEMMLHQGEWTIAYASNL